MSLVTRKPVFGVYDQVRLKPACAATATSWRLEISDIEKGGILLSRQRITKMLIKDKQKSPGRATSRSRSQPPTPGGREKVTQINGA